MSDMAIVASLDPQIANMKQDKTATEARLRAKDLQQQYWTDSLAETLATNSTALLELVFKAKEAEENAEKTEGALREQIAELVEQRKDTVAQLTACNKGSKDELDNEKKERLRLMLDDENQRVKDAEETAKRAKGEANHMVKSKAGQLNKLKVMCDAYRERYGKLDDANASAATISGVNALSSTPTVNQNGGSQISMNEAVKNTGQSFANVDSISSQSAAVWDANSQDPDGAPGASSTVDGRSDTCPNPGSSFGTRSSGNQQGLGYKKRNRRGTRPRSSRTTYRPGEGLTTNTPTGPKAQREVQN